MALGSTQPLRNVYQDIPMGKRRPVREADNLTNPHVPIVMKSGSLNLLESSGTHRAYYGTPVPFFITIS
jgi:hypothetical protein